MSISFLERGGDGVWVHQPAQPIIRSWTGSKNEHFISLAGERWRMGFESIDQPSRSSEVEQDQKMNISFFWLERGNEWGLSLPTSPADHQKLNVIQKWVFHFIGWRRVMDGVWVHRPAWLIIRSEHNPKRSISFVWLERGGGWGLSPSTSLANIRSWT